MLQLTKPYRTSHDSGALLKSATRQRSVYVSVQMLLAAMMSFLLTSNVWGNPQQKTAGNESKPSELETPNRTTVPATKSKALEPAPANAESQPHSSGTEHWVGWIDTPERQLRWVVQLHRTASESNSAITATSWNPDLITKPNPMTSVSIQDQYWKLEWGEIGSKDVLKYEAIQEGEDKTTGFLILGEKSIPVVLNKIAELPEENARNLGGDIVWLDQLPPSVKNPNAKRFDMRLRFYTEGPFALNGPRILLDSMNSKLVGVPVTLEDTEGDSLHFQIPSLKATYVATLAESENEMKGTFTRNDAKSELKFFLLNESKQETKDSGESVASNNSAIASNGDKEAASTKVDGEPDRMPEQKNAPTSEEKEKVHIQIQGPRPSPLKHDLAKNERAFTLDVTSPIDRRATAKSSAADSSDQRPKLPRTLGGTISYPTNDDAGPATIVIFLSTFEPNDRDGTVGQTKFYKELAQWFAERQIASVRLDDRGVGESVPIEGMTPEDQIRDLQSVVDFLIKDPKIAATKIGFFGHGEGADLAMRFSANDPRIAFNILFAPPGLNGSELSRARLIRSAMDQGLQIPQAEALANFQYELQKIAITASGDTPGQVQRIRQLVADQWKTIGPLMGSKLDLTKAADRSELEANLLQQVASFDTPISRETLQANPSTVWMLGNAPTLAMFGGRDVVIDLGSNFEPLEQAVLRNNSSRFTMLQLPKSNHWFSESVVSDDDLANKPLKIDPQFLSSLNAWLQEKGF